MEAADLLCDSLFRWMENRKECAEKLLELAQELENVRQGSNIAQVVGAAASVASITGAAVATFFTGGLAFPLLVAAAVSSPLVEAGISRSKFNKATELIKENEKVGTSIQKQLRDLKDQCGGTQLGDHADELDCEVTTQLMWALARRDSTHVPLDFLRDFNRATFYRHMTPGGLDPANASHFIGQSLNLISFTAVITGSLMLSAKGMGKNIGQIGIKAAAKAGSRALGATGFGLCVYDLIDKSEELVKGKRFTEASELLRDSAREILEGQQELQEQLDAMHKINQKLFRMKNLIKNLEGYSLSLTGDGKKIIDYIMETCTDNRVVSWLQELTKNQTEFVNLLTFVKETLSQKEDEEEVFKKKKLRRPGGGHTDIVFVAHGAIVDQFMPAAFLVPTPTIRDTILYSPWNCAINARAAFGIAQGNIDVTNRQFYNRNGNTVDYEPNPLPDRWNSMRGSLHNIPGILLAPVTPEEVAYTNFLKLWMNRGMENEDRIIIPYFSPENLVNAFGAIPLYMFIFVTSFILMLNGKTATVHLAACLNRLEGSPLRPVEWRTQYAYTNDGTGMTMNMDDRYMNSMLFRALRSMFDRNHD
ncbi:uncharacterized protein LOC125267165 [Megalobrama amblycephala]|uniref:uncharacterized protein LOC125267165 n=1 Tax=Megalobrama amblycephala TaxID=75352 RepID=UPI002013FF3D|nr:uncharacterized protein LOC125267165 [Megalobrama amblycephala]